MTAHLHLLSRARILGRRLGWMGLLMLTLAGQADAAGRGPALLTQIRFTAEPPVIDGRLDDPCWRRADTVTGFTVPVSLDLARDSSEVRILFDSERISIALKAYESSPKSMSIRTAPCT